MPVEVLSNNIKFLRTKHKLSQEGLAKEIGIKRSSIAAYECKGVEPRLPVLLRLAKFFDIDLTEFIELRLSDESPEHSSFLKENNIHNREAALKEVNEPAAQMYHDHIQRVNKIVEGFKTYFEYKLQQEQLNESTIRIRDDVRHFISILEHILESNETFRDNHFSNEA